MAKPRADSGIEISLFPFLSILTALIGCLTLIIVTLTVVQMNQGDKEPEEVEIAREYVKLEKENEIKSKELEQLRIDIETLTSQQKDFQMKREKLRLLQELLASNEETDARRDELIAKFNLLVQINKNLDNDEKQLLAQIEELKKQLDLKSEPPDAPRVLVRPTGSSGNVEPYFVEIADNAVLIHRSLTEEPLMLPTASLVDNQDFIELLKTVAAKPYRKLIFLVRGNEGSLANLTRANKLVTNFNNGTGNEIVPGKVPIPGEGKLDLSVFAQFLK